MANKIENYDIVGSYNNQFVSEIDAERSVNLFEYLDQLAKKQKVLLPTSGLINTNTIYGAVIGGFRGQFVYKGNMFVVVGNSIFLITPQLAVTPLYTSLLTNSGYVGIDANQTQVMFVDGNAGYIYSSITGLVTKITDTNFTTQPGPPIDVTALDGFFVVCFGSTNIFILSQFENGFSWTPLQQGTITSHPGTFVACRALHRRLFLFSQNFTEVWENQGVGTNLPFRRNNNFLIEYGCAAIGSVQASFDKMFFLSQDQDGLGSVMMVDGVQATPVSGRALDRQLSAYAANPNLGVSDATGLLIKENGLIFYRLNFTKANHTFVFGVTMSDQENFRWHEEEVLNGNRHPAQTHGFFNGVNYVGHYSLPILYVLASTVSNNDGEAIRRMRIGKPFVPEGYQRTRIDRYQLDLLQGNVEFFSGDQNFQLLTENGIPIFTESGEPILLENADLVIQSDQIPEVFLSISRDGGQSYGTEIIAPMGAIGERSFRTVWRKLGTIPRGQAFVPRIQFFNNIPFIILGAAWSYEVMPE